LSGRPHFIEMKRCQALKCELSVRRTSFVLFLVLRFKNFLIKLKKGVKHGCEEDFDDCWGFCGGL
jgi:hypothetical protein